MKNIRCTSYYYYYYYTSTTTTTTPSCSHHCLCFHRLVCLALITAMFHNTCIKTVRNMFHRRLTRSGRAKYPARRRSHALG